MMNFFTLDSLRSHPMLWEKTDSGFTARAFKQEPVAVSTATLAAVDTRLPRLLNYLLADTPTANLVSGRLMATLNFWHHPAPLPVNTKTPGTRRYIVHVRNVVDSRIEKDHVVANLVYVEIEQVDDMEVAFAPVTALLEELSFSWMEQYFPNSVARLRAGQVLSLAPRELADYVFQFTEQPVVAAILPSSLL